jgi:hypothetical protein
LGQWRREYVLPARFDDTPLPGLLPDMVSVDLRTRTLQQFAAMIADKLPQSTAYWYLDEVIEVPAARAPGLQEQLERALAEGWLC